MRFYGQLKIYGIIKLKEPKNEKNISDNFVGVSCYGFYDRLQKKG